ncbi:MAG: oligosaccharide flippase family protein [Oscillospiraceae bacterium]|jgi:stage V sporulation protein B|nr:oligosaccharide flippase family protein [Oscillospiraceae bacterium]
MNKKRGLSFAESAMLLTAVNLFSQLLGFAYRVWLSRLVSPVALGVYQLVMPVYSVVMSLCVSGLTVAVSRLTATHLAKNDHRSARQVVRVSLMGYIALIMCVSLAVIPFSDAISVYLLGDARTRMGLLLLLPLMLLTGWENVHKNYFYGSKNVVPPAISEIVEQISRTAAILGLLMWLRPLYEETQVALIVTGMIVSEVLSAALLTFFYRRRMARIESALPPKALPARAGAARSVIQIAVPVAASNVASNLIGSVNSVMIPGRLIVSGLPPEQSLSAYGVAFGMTMPLLALPMAFIVAVSLTALPRVSEARALGDSAAVRRSGLYATLAATAVIVPFTALLIPFGRPVAQALFNNAQAGQFMEPLAIATVFGCYEYVFGSILNGLGLQRRTAAVHISTGLLQLGLAWYLVAMPNLRLMGYVMAYGASNALGAVLCLMFLLGELWPGRSAPHRLKT